MAIDAERFEDELEDCDGDIDEWMTRKGRENESFWGMELDPEKEKRLNYIKALCRKLHKLDKHIEYVDMPLTNRNRNGMAQVLFPPTYSAFRDVVAVLAKLYAVADDVALTCPYALYDEEIDGDEEPWPKEIVMTFGVHDMWLTYGKAPFGV